ncbi:glutaminase [Corallococcus caeni]|uniref:Glutaminase n=1 Tax=Corallococcus caeni TaxID=3082388 RepID=A0ABQ6QP54_9BACT|nr:glutaminase [Corallococcus sp. NO1]
MDYQAVLSEVWDAVRPVLGQGRVATYIPALAAVDPHRFGMALATVEGDVYGVGDWREPFSIQSISKVFTLALALSRDGDALWRRVGKEPSGNPFNSLVQLEYEQGIPRNPFINAGALVITDRLQRLTGDARGTLRDFLRAESGNPLVDFDPVIAASEAEHGHRNSALAHFMASYGNMESAVPEVLEHYFWQCSLAMSCADLARACGFLARHGQRADGARLLTRSQAKQVNAVMLTCGTYDAAGEFAYRVGLPGKSGVGGGIIAVIPNRCALCVWSPGLDARGNSVAGVEALDRFTTLTGLSIF